MNSRVFYTLIRLAVVCAALGLAAGCDDVSTAELKTPVYKTGLKDSDDNKTSAFRKDFPLQAASYDRNNESTFMSKYKGSSARRLQAGGPALPQEPVARLSLHVRIP